MERTGIDIVVRLYDTSELPRLCHCAFALIGQSLATAPTSEGFAEPLCLHIMLQRFSVDEVQDTRAALEMLSPLSEAFSMHLHNWEYPEPFELRVPLLNWGLELTRRRYFTCLEVTELPLPGAFARLLGRLRATSAVLALGGMAIQPVRWWGEVVLPLPVSLGVATYESSSPLFLVDRSRVIARKLVFRSGKPCMEIADFVERLSRGGAADGHCLSEQLGLRQVPG